MIEMYAIKYENTSLQFKSPWIEFDGLWFQHNENKAHSIFLSCLKFRKIKVVFVSDGFSTVWHASFEAMHNKQPNKINTQSVASGNAFSLLHFDWESPIPYGIFIDYGLNHFKKKTRNNIKFKSAFLVLLHSIFWLKCFAWFTQFPFFFLSIHFGLRHVIIKNCYRYTFLPTSLWVMRSI